MTHEPRKEPKPADLAAFEKSWTDLLRQALYSVSTKADIWHRPHPLWVSRVEPLGEEGLYKAVKRLYERAGVRVRNKKDPKGHIPYDLRDTFANTVEEAVGPGGREVAERLMGHESGRSIELHLVNRQPQELAIYSPLRRRVCKKSGGVGFLCLGAAAVSTVDIARFMRRPGP